MYVKKRMSLLLFAALAMVLFTACGRWDFSREAAKAANEAQGANPVVTFDTSRALTDALRDAAGENIQPADIEAALKADGTLTELLAGRSDLDIYFAAGDQSADDAAAAIAAQFGRLTGRKPEAFIAMVKADNGYFYAAVVTYRTGGSGGGSGSGSDDGNGGTTTPDPDQPGTKKEYTVSWTDPDNGTITVTTSDGANVAKDSQVTENTTITITVTADNGYEVTSVKAGGTKLEGNGTYTHAVRSDVEITATITEKTVKSIEVIERPEELTCNNTLNLSQIKIKVTYEDDTWREIFASAVNGVTVEHEKQTFTLESGISKIIRALAKGTNYEDKVDEFLNKFTKQVEGNKLEVETVGIVFISDAYWDAKFNVTYKEKSTTFNVKLTCNEAFTWIGTILCEHCPNWDGKDNIAPSARGSQSAHFDTEG